MMLKTILFFTLSLYLTSPFSAELVKKSKSGICHNSASSYYFRTKNYTPYNSLQACLDSGGQLTKSNKSKTVSSSEYSRSQFGSGWKDIDKDCQGARTEALIAQSVGAIHYNTNKQCEVVRGKWISPFTGEIIYIASTIDIDHVVPLKFAWIFGADKWTKEKRVKFKFKLLLISKFDLLTLAELDTNASQTLTDGSLVTYIGTIGKMLYRAV